MAEQPPAPFEEHEEHQVMLELQQSCFLSLAHLEELLAHVQHLTDEDKKYGFLDEYYIPEDEHAHGDYECEYSLAINPFDDEVHPELSITRSTDNSDSSLWREITAYGQLLDRRLEGVEITLVSRATSVLFNFDDGEVRVYESDWVSYLDEKGVESYLLLSVDNRPEELDHRDSLGLSAEESEYQVDDLYSQYQLTQSAELLVLAAEAITTVFEEQQLQAAQDALVKQAEERFNNIQLLGSDEVEMLWEAGEQVVAERPEAIRKYSVSWDNSVELELSDFADYETAVEIEYKKVPSESVKAITIKVSYIDGKTYRYRLTPKELTDLDATKVPVMRAEGDKLLDALVGLASVRSE